MKNEDGLALEFESVVPASGDVLIEKTTTGSVTTLRLGASNLNAFLGVNYGQAGEFGVKVTGAGVAMLVDNDGSNAANYAISPTGCTVVLVGLAGFHLTGPHARNHRKTRRATHSSLPPPRGLCLPDT